MIKANFKAYSTYVTDSLYQWDLNQVLTVSGLNLSVAPEVHFSNSKMDKAIVRQATLKDYVVSVDIPNSLLQESLPIRAHIGIYENGTFKVIELVEIPVIAKKRPADYQIQDSDEEIYSFKALENALKNKADSAIINARINNIIAHNNDTDGNTELIDIRTDANGTVHKSAGEAIRAQFSKTSDLLETKSSNTILNSVLDVIEFDYQYLDYEARIEGEYWDFTTTKQSSGYYRYPVITGLSPGTYHALYLSGNFTIIENVKTGETVKLSSIIGNNTITVDYDFNLYATVSVSQKGIFAKGGNLENYVYGAYNIKYKDIVPSHSRIFYCGATREITKLKDAINIATQYMDSILYVDRGTYDLIEEFGSSYFENYTGDTKNDIYLKNRIHIIFEQGAKVICNYTGDNTYVHTIFSPFNSGDYGFTLENAWVESTNTRYTMHDERAGNPIPYKNIYKRCTFIHDSTATSWGSHQALGGGLGCWGDILIEDCYMSSVGCEELLTYHNAGYNNPSLIDYSSNIVIRGCYLEGTIRINSTGYSPRITNAYVSGNSVTSEILSGKTTEDALTNIALHAWNNTIRI